MSELQITSAEAALLMARIKAAKEEGRLLDVIMPNAKRLRDCTGAYVGQIGKAMVELGYLMEAEFGTKPAGSRPARFFFATSEPLRCSSIMMAKRRNRETGSRVGGPHGVMPGRLSYALDYPALRGNIVRIVRTIHDG